MLQESTPDTPICGNTNNSETERAEQYCPKRCKYTPWCG